MDDASCSFETIDAAREAIDQLHDMLSLAGMASHKIASNNPQCLHDIPSDRILNKELVSVLGMKWALQADTLTFRFIQSIPEADIITQCVVASQLGQIFDPQGLVVPVSVTAKAIFQETWAISSSWDSPLPPHLAQAWKKWRESLSALDGFTLPCNVLPSGGKIHYLVTYCDASIVAYACAVYLVVDVPGHVDPVINLVFGKSRLKPLKEKLTVPRLEMMACLIAARCATFVKKELNLEHCGHFFRTVLFLWTG